MRKQAVEELERYHIDVVDDLTAPLLHAQVYVKDSGTTILTVYAMTVELKLEEMLLDPVTSLRVTAITWSKSNLLVEFESGIEEAILKTARSRLGDFTLEQYHRFVICRAKSELEKAGKLPGWLKAEPTKRSEESSQKQ